MSAQAQPLAGRIPPPPPGFKLEQASATATASSIPPPPPGFTPEDEQKPPAEKTGIWAGVKRNTVGAAQGLYHAVADSATDEERQHFKDIAAKEGAAPHEPSAPELAYHRLLEKPSDEVSAGGSKYFAAGKQDLGQGNFWRGVNEYLSGTTNKALSAVPMAGPCINSIAKRAESGDVTGAATDVAFGKAAEHAPAIVGKAGEVTGKALRNETGNLRPSVKEASRAVGWMAGHYSGIPGADIAGALGAPALLETLTPSREPTVADAVPITQSPYHTQNQAKLAAAAEAQKAAAAEEAAAPKAGPKKESPD